MRLISPRLHTIIGSIVGVLLLLAPNIFGFNDLGGAAVGIPRLLGLIIILSELTVQGSYSGIWLVSMKVHLVLDAIMGLLLAVSPWLFSFSDRGTNAWLPHLVVGVLLIGAAVMTEPADEETRSHIPHHY